MSSTSAPSVSIVRFSVSYPGRERTRSVMSGRATTDAVLGNDCAERVATSSTHPFPAKCEPICLTRAPNGAKEQLELEREKNEIELT